MSTSYQKNYLSELWWQEEENGRLLFSNRWGSKGKVVKEWVKRSRFFNISWFLRIALKRLFFASMCALKPTVLTHCGLLWALQLDRSRSESLFGHLLAAAIRASYLNSLQFPHYNMGRVTLMLITGYCEDLIIQQMLLHRSK